MWGMWYRPLCSVLQAARIFATAAWIGLAYIFIGIFGFACRSPRHFGTEVTFSFDKLTGKGFVVSCAKY